MGEVLLYNIPEGEKRRRIRVALLRLGIPGREIAPADYGHPIGYLAGLEGFGPGEDPGADEVFSDEMLVMCGLSQKKFNAFLDALRASRVTVALKAVLTETNAAWSSCRLCSAIRAEHEAMRRGLPPVDQRTVKP